LHADRWFGGRRSSGDWPYLGDALVAEIVTLVAAAGYYLLTGTDTDIGAIYGQRSDERQMMVRMSASRLALIVALAAAFVCAVVSVALDDGYWQPDVIASAAGASYLLGLSIYGSHDEQSRGDVGGIMAGRSESAPDGRSD
jgi:hypothetical protein